MTIWEGITLNGKHSFKDFGLLMQNFEIGSPNKSKVTVKVPYSSRQVDFSTIMGFQPYERRTLTFEFGFFNDYDMVQLQDKRIQILNWLMETNGDSIIEFDLIKNYYFMGEVVVGPEVEMAWNSTGTLKLTIDAHPFKIAKLLEGNDVWDNFNFTSDIAQNVEYNIVGSANISIYNVGFNPIEPIIITDNNMALSIGDVTYQLVSGNNSLDGLVLNVGENSVKIVGTGHVKFEFRKEVL